MKQQARGAAEGGGSEPLKAPGHAPKTTRRVHSPARKKRAIIERVAAVPDTQEPLASPLQDARQERFCQALLSEPTIAAAALKAGYSPETARTQGSRLLTNVGVMRRVAFLLDRTSSRLILRRRDVLRNASQRAAAALTDVAALVGLPWAQFCEAIRSHPSARAIRKVKRGMEYDKGSGTWSPAYVQEIELFDPRGSERLLADLLGWDAPKQVTLSPGAGTPGATAGVVVNLPAPEKAPVGVLEGPEAGGAGE